MTTYNASECRVDRDFTITINTDSEENYKLLLNLVRLCSNRDEFRDTVKGGSNGEAG